MSTSIISRTAFAVGLLTSTVSAAFNANSKNNVAVYWGGAPSPGNRPLAELCANPSVDIVNIGFINGFPTEVGQYPKSNHGNACYAETYTDPTTGQPSGLYTTCNGVEAAIKQCQALGKKVMLSLGGAEPPNYYLKNKAVAEWFAEFLIGAYGPVTKEWTDAGSPRPFGSAVLDGFDLDLEADPKRMPGGNSDLIFANYEFFGNYVKAHAPQMLLSGAPQCIVPDARLYPVLTKVPFDMLFVQFYNTEDCSARLGLTDLNKGSTGFSFDTWADWLVKNAAQGDKVKLYLGLPAGPSAVGANYRHHYLQPREANLLIQKYKSRASFGGVMVWEAMVSTNNQNFCKSYDYWVKKSLENTFGRDYTTSACATSSSVLPSSTKVSSTKISSSTLVSSTKVSSSSIVSSTKVSSSTLVSSTKVSSSSVISSTKVSSSSIASSTKISSSSVVSSTKVSSSSIASSTKISSSKLSSSTPVSSKASSSAYIVSPTPKASSTMYPASSSFSSSAYYVSSSAAPSSSSVYIDTSVSAYSSQYSVVKSSSAEIVPVSKDSYPTVSAPEEYPESTPYLSAPQSTPHVSAAESSYYDEFPAYSASSSVYYYSESIPEAASSTPCTTSSQYYVAETSTPYLSAAESSYYNIEVPASSVYEVYPVETPDASSKGEIYSTGKGYDSIPTVTKGVEYPSKPSDATTTVVTTTYVDVCPTGLTTKTTTVVKTVCNSCAKPTQYPEDVPEGWTTSVYVSKTLTVTITKPAHPATDVPAYPSSIPEGHGAGYSAIPQPSSPSSNKPEVPVYKEEYPEQPAQPQYPTAAVSSKAQQYPAQSGVPEYPKKPVEDITSAYVQHTLSKVAVPVYTPAPYPSAPAPAPYVPAPANNGTTAYVPLPTGTGKPTKPSSYSPAEFEGAASRFGVGLTAMVGVVAAFFVL